VRDEVALLLLRSQLGVGIGYGLLVLYLGSLDGIFIRNDLQLTDISQKMFGNWGVIQICSGK
jgi:hypothetical protein